MDAWVVILTLRWDNHNTVMDPGKKFQHEQHHCVVAASIEHAWIMASDLINKHSSLVSFSLSKTFKYLYENKERQLLIDLWKEQTDHSIEIIKTKFTGHPLE